MITLMVQTPTKSRFIMQMYIVRMQLLLAPPEYNMAISYDLIML